MKKINTLLCALCALWCVSCDYLDIVPDEKATAADAFQNPTSALRYLYSCYSYIQDPRAIGESIDLITGDAVVGAWPHEASDNFSQGNFTPSNPIINYWNTYYKGIRQCYLLKESIGTVPGLPQKVIDDYIAEADFLIAYYHYYMLRMYGPIILVNGLINMNDTGNPMRSTYDECVNWIAERFAEVATRLPEERTGEEYGRATSIAAMAIRARMFLTAASPQFNGGEKFKSMYADFKNQDGTQLISTIYDPQKWKRAEDAYRELLTMIEGKYRLYKNIPGTFPSAPLPSIEPVRTLRFMLGDPDTPENLWAWCGNENSFMVQSKSVPRWAKRTYGGIAPTLLQIERFYTENGLPIDEDPAYNYEGRFDLVTIPEDWPWGEAGLQTLEMNMQREPRFYAWIAFHNGYYEVQGEDKTDGIYSYATRYKRGPYKQLVQFTKLSNMGVNANNTEGTKTGYLNKKGANPGTFVTENSLTLPQYPWPFVTVREVYLSYAEACIETGNLEEGKKYINLIRERAGIPTVEEAWGSIGVTLDQNKLREIVHRERHIELYLENHNFWDIRRWGDAEVMNEKPMGLNILATELSEFAQPTEVNVTRRFIPAHYLLPIPIAEMSNNLNMVQNPGYE